MLRMYNRPALVLPDNNFPACAWNIGNEGPEVFFIDMSFLYRVFTLRQNHAFAS